MIKILKRLILVIDTQQLLQCKKMKFRNAWPRRIVFNQLAVLILYDIHMDYAEQLLYQINQSSLIELVLDTDILWKIIAENNEQARKNCSRVGTLHTFIPSDESNDLISNFFPLARHINRTTKCNNEES